MSFSHRASETVQLLKQMTPDFIPPMATQQPRPKAHGLCSVGDYAGASLQRDQGCWWTASTDCGGMEWEQLGQHVIDNVIRQCAGDCEAVSMQTVHSLNILCDWHSDYHNGRYCRFLSVWLYCKDYIAILVQHCIRRRWLDCSLQRIFIIYSTKSNISRICIL